MVTVLMPVYNGEKYLKEAIESVLNQTYKDFEFLIINDGSTDRSSEIISSYSDPRIKFIDNNKNYKLITTLNQGLKLAKGKYIARMDCDDVCFPERLEEQVKYMESNPEIGISGTWCVRSDNHMVIKKPVLHEDIKIFLLKGPAILHPTAILKKEILDKYHLNFNHQYIHAEDYEFWVKGSMLFKLGNIPKVLLKYRKHPEQVSQYYSDEQKLTTMKIMGEQLEKLGISPTDDFLKLHYELFTKTKLSNKQVFELQSYINLLINANEKKLYYNPAGLKKFIFPYQDYLWDRCTVYNFKTLSLFHKSNFIKSGSFSIKLYLKVIKRIFTNSLQYES